MDVTLWLRRRVVLRLALQLCGKDLVMRALLLLLLLALLLLGGRVQIRGGVCDGSGDRLLCLLVFLGR